MPVIWLSLRFSTLISERLPNSGGIDPLRRFSQRYIPVTLPSASLVTPNHSLTGLLLSQLELSSQFAPSVAL